MSNPEKIRLVAPRERAHEARDIRLTLLSINEWLICGVVAIIIGAFLHYSSGLPFFLVIPITIGLTLGAHWILMRWTKR